MQTSGSHSSLIRESSAARPGSGLPSKRPARRDTIRDVLILLGLSLVIGAYLIGTTRLISKDGVFYIEWARQLSSGPGKLVHKLSIGYPGMIFGTHWLLSSFLPDSYQTWILSGQVISLLFRMLTVIPIYLIALMIANRRTAFLCCLILLILPDPAHFSCDVLRDWPHLFFLASGFLALLRGSQTGRWQPFAWAGLLAGCGYWIRMEAAQLLLYGLAWMVAGLTLPFLKQNKHRLMISLVALLAGFLLFFIPHARLSERIVPVKIKRLLSDSRPAPMTPEPVEAAATEPGELGDSVLELMEGISENLMYVFLPFWLLGLVNRLSKSGRAKLTERFYMTALILVNTLMLLVLNSVWGYMSRRHVLPMVALTICYVPIGLGVFSEWAAAGLSARRTRPPVQARQVFRTLLVIGAVICLPKLLRPIGSDKLGYLQAARWIAEHTPPDVLVASTDRRLPFYAQRPCVLYEGRRFPRKADLCLILEERNNPVSPPASFEKAVSFPVKPSSVRQISIYRIRGKRTTDPCPLKQLPSFSSSGTD